MANGPSGWHFAAPMDRLHLHKQMFTHPGLLWGTVTLLVSSLAFSSTPFAHAAEKDLDHRSYRFGFTGPEAFPIDNAIGHLRSGDIDGDGLVDLVVANNLKARVALLLNQTGKPVSDPVATPSKTDINELPPDARFKIESITSEKRIASLLLTDLNGDGLPDLAYVGEPKPIELVVHYSRGKLQWDAPKRWQIEDAQLVPDSLAAGDLNADGRIDVALLADTHVAVLYQKEDKTLGEPEKQPFTGTIRVLKLEDVTGDGLKDMVLAHPDNANPVRFRIQSSSGQLGPELHFASPPIRSLAVEDLDGDKRAEVITIGATSGRASVANLARMPSAKLTGSLQQGQFQVLAFGRSGKARRGVAWGDLNADEMPDLLIAQPETGQLTLHLQQAGGDLGPARVFPSLAGVQQIAVLNSGAGKPAEIFLLSPDERQTGRTRLTPEGRIPFPEPVGVEGKPLVMTAGTWKPGQPNGVAVITESGERQLSILNPDGSSASRITLPVTFKATPTELVFHDLDQDGLNDLIALIPYEKLKVFRQQADKEPVILDLALPGGAMEQPWASQADVDGDGRSELLLGQRNFVRAVILKKDESDTWVLAVKDQINGVSSASRISGAAALPLSGGKSEAVFLLDAEKKALSVCERDPSSVWRATASVPLPFSDFTELRPLALGGSVVNGLACVGNSAAAWLSMSGEVWELTERDTYETPVKQGRLSGTFAGDLNSDGRRDLVFLETSKSHVDIAAFSEARKIVPGNRWQVFEERSFRSRRSEGVEPREALVADLDGDKRPDLAVIVHDRVLVYCQQPPK